MYMYVEYSSYYADARPITSMFLKNTTAISHSGPNISIKCEFLNCSSSVDCVLVYREYGNKTLGVKRYSCSIEFPVTVSIDKPNRYYTFAIFGININTTDQEPITTYMYMYVDNETTDTPMSSPPAPGKYTCIYTFFECCRKCTCVV